MKKILLSSILSIATALTTFGQAGLVCWREISAGTNFSMAIRSDGTLWAWGLNGNRLGLSGNTLNQNLPVQVGNSNDWMTVSCGDVHTLAVKNNGTLWAWGDGIAGALGNGLFNSATWTVTQVGTATDWMEVSAGNRFSLALKTNGTLWSWGQNNVGQLGQGNLTNLNLPMQVGLSTNWAAIDAGDAHSLALDNTGLMYASGSNTSGQFGDGTNTSSNSFVLSNTTTWSQISAGFDHSMAIDASSALFTFGNNTNGQLGNGTNTASNTPVMIGFSSAGTVGSFIKISAGNSFSLAIRNDNTLHSTGLNTTGQLGIGTIISVNSLNQAGTLNTWDKISAGSVHSLALEFISVLHSSGRNMEGQLGLGSNVNASSLQQLACSPGLGLDDETMNHLDVSVYPNPVNDKLSVKYVTENPSAVQLTITDVQGKVVFAENYPAGNLEQNIELNFGDLNAGLYFLNINHSGGIQSSKIVKK